jgi:hypothetical protein
VDNPVKTQNGGKTMEIITRKEAKEKGLTHYFTGKPCKHGHIATRRALTGYCNECCSIKYAQNRQDEEYLEKERVRHRRWKRANKDAINARRRVRDKEWYVPPPLGPRQLAKNAGETVYFTDTPCKHGHTSYRRVSDGSCIECKKEKASTEEAKRNAALKSRKWRRLNPDKEKEKAKRWAEKNKPAILAKSMRRRCAELNATPAWADHDKILIKYKERETMEKLTGLPYDVDHYYPIQSDVVCGLHVSANLRVVLRRDNRRKSNKMPEEFYGVGHTPPMDYAN